MPGDRAGWLGASPRIKYRSNGVRGGYGVRPLRPAALLTRVPMQRWFWSLPTAVDTRSFVEKSFFSAISARPYASSHFPETPHHFEAFTAFGENRCKPCAKWLWDKKSPIAQ